MSRFTILLLLGVLCALTATYDAKSHHKAARKVKQTRAMLEKKKLSQLKLRTEQATTEGGRVKRLLSALQKFKREEGGEEYETPDYTGTPDYGDFNYTYNSDWMDDYEDFGPEEEDLLNQLAAEFGVDMACVDDVVGTDVPDLDLLLACDGVKPVVVHMMGFAIHLMTQFPQIVEGEIWNVFFKEDGIISVLFAMFGDDHGSGGGSSEEGCDGDEFACGNGHCVPGGWHCDYMDDCGDNSDEQDCPEQECAFQCGNGDCLAFASWECDGDNDCDDASDEQDCDKRHVKSLLAAVKRKLAKRKLIKS